MGQGVKALCTLLLTLLCGVGEAQEVDFDKKMIEQGLVDIQQMDAEILVELKYATEDNFVGENMYGTLRRAYLLPHFARKVVRAQALLRERHPDFSLLIYDAARPISVQRRMRRLVEGTPLQIYVADGQRGGRHNYGVAVDLTIADKDGRPLDMGAPFDHFGRTAWIGDGKNTTLQHFKEYIAQMQRQGLISAEAAANRTLLVEVMDAVGLRPYAKEWWHYQERVSMSRTRELYKLLDF